MSGCLNTPVHVHTRIGVMVRNFRITHLILAIGISGLMGCTEKGGSGSDSAGSGNSTQQGGTGTADPSAGTVAIAACADSADPCLTGTVMAAADDGAAAAPAGGARVYVEGHEDISTTAGADGAFVLKIQTVPAAGLRLIPVSKEDLDKQPFTVISTYEINGKTFAKRLPNVVFAGGRALDLGKLTLSETGAIKGKVQLGDGADPLGTDVYVPGTSWVAKAAEDGSFIIMYVPEGEYSLIYQKPGYYYASQTGIIVLSKQVAYVDSVVLKADDDTPPDTTISSGPDRMTNAQIATFAFAANDGSQEFMCKIDQLPLAPCRSPSSFAQIGEGVHEFSVVGVDGSGNVDPSAATWRWTVDLTAPVITVESRPAEITAETNATIELALSEASSTLQCIHNDVEITCSPTISLTDLAPGFHNLQIAATDQAGNKNAPKVITWQVDTLLVNTIALATPPSLTNATVATIAFVANKQASFMCRLDAEPYQVCTSPVTYSGLGTGPHTVMIKATDAAGTPEVDPLVVSWTVDATPPSVPVLVQVAGGLTHVPTPSLTWGASSPDTASYDLEVDVTPSFNSTMLRRFAGVTLTSQTVVPQLFDGTWHYRVRAVDQAGNASAWSSALNFVLDTQPPEIPVTDYLPDPTNANQPEFSWAAAPDAVRYRLVAARDNAFANLLIDNSNLETLTYTPVVPIGDGPVFWKVAALDAAGNQSQFSIAKYFTIDTSLPGTPVVGSVPAVTNDSTPTFSWGSVTDAATYRVQVGLDSGFAATVINDGSISTTTFTPSSALPDNVYYLRVASINSTGNQGGYSEPKMFVVDTSAPPPPVLTAYNPSPTNDLTPTLTWSDGGGGAVSWDILVKQGAATLDSQTGLTARSYTPSSALPPGTISWQVRARDAAGNVGSYATASTVVLTSAATWKFKFPKVRRQLDFGVSRLRGFFSSGETLLGLVDYSYGDILKYRSQEFKFNYWNNRTSTEPLIGKFNPAQNGGFVSKDSANRLMITAVNGEIQVYRSDLAAWSVVAPSFCTGSTVCNIYGAIDEADKTHVLYLVYGNWGMYYRTYDKIGNSWSAPLLVASSGEGPKTLGNWLGWWIPDFFFRQYLHPSSLSLNAGKPSVFYYASHMSGYFWKELDSGEWVTREFYPNSNGTMFLNAESIYFDQNGWPVIERYVNGSDFRWGGSSFESTTNPTLKISMTVSNNYQPPVEKDTYLAFSAGTTTTYHPIEDDIGEIWTVATDNKGNLSRYGMPLTAVINQTNNNAVEVAPSWKVWSIDKSPSIGTHTSAVIDPSGNPRIAYRSGVSNTLKAATYDGSSWTVESVDAAVGTGYFTSTGRKTDGKLVIAHYDANLGDLKVATQSGGGSWSNFTVASSGDVGRYASLAMNGDNYAISWHDETNGTLRLSSFDGTSWSHETVDDSSDDVGEFTSLKMAGPVKHIAYYDADNSTLKYAKYDGGSWSIETLDATADVGRHASLALKSTGDPVIAYYDATNGDLKFAEYIASSWVISTLQSAGDVGQYASVAIDTGDEPHICYYDATNTALAYSNRDVNWAHRLIDGDWNSDDKGQYCSMVINPVNGSPSASYFDNLEGGVNFVDGMVQY